MVPKYNIYKDLKQNEAQSARAESTHKVVLEDVPLVEFMYLIFTRMSGESYRRRLIVAVLVLRISNAN